MAVYDSTGTYSGDYTGSVAYDSDSQQFTVSCSCTLPDTQYNHLAVSIQCNGGTPLVVDSYVQDPAYAALGPVTSASGSLVNATEGEQFSNVVIASFTPSDPNAVAGDFTVNIDGGEENPVYTTVQANSNGGFDVLATSTYPTANHLCVPVTINGFTLYATVNVTVGISDLSAATGHSTPQNSPFSGTLATFESNSLPADDPFSAVIDWGDGLTSAGTVADSSGVFSVSGSHAYAATGPYYPTVEIYSADGDLVGSLTGSARPEIVVTDAVFTFASVALPLDELNAGNVVQVAYFTDSDSAAVSGDIPRR